ncbi:hypothetical protein C8R44DRAFT_138939 [Mycena epipterygia]|nr:hypothetical protein C8R44DRAFT_138939 [Mycena epipterygia]
MAQCAASDCTQQGNSRCGRCKARAYCSLECQKKDWSKHKKQCQSHSKGAEKPKFNQSPFGTMFNIFSGLAAPISSRGVFFAPMFGYTADRSALVYADLVNAYRLMRMGSHLNAARITSDVQNMDFSEWLDRVERAGILPEWWTAQVNRRGIEVYAREDEWGSLDRDVSRDEIRDSLDKPQRMMVLEMMVERVVDNTEA